MNIFYAPPEQISENRLTLAGQEARHAAKTLRYRRSDDITVVDGVGGWYEGKISQISDQKVWVQISSVKRKDPELPQAAIAIGLIKKRDRLEVAVEKAVELGAAEVAVFRSERSVKQNVRMDRLEALAVSAMKQSLQARLPDVKFYNSLPALLNNYSQFNVLAAHISGERLRPADLSSTENNFLLITGPEGDFTKDELHQLKEQKAKFIALGSNRLRTETATITFLTQFLMLTH